MYKRKDGIWYSNFVVSGVTVNKSLRTTDEAVAREREKDMKVDLRTTIDGAKMVLSEAIDRQFQESWMYTKTGEVEVSRMRWIVALIGDLPMNSILEADVNRVKSTLIEQGKSHATVNHYIASFRTICRRATDRWRVMDRCPDFEPFKE